MRRDGEELFVPDWSRRRGVCLFGDQPAEAGCQLIHATHSARSQAKAIETSRALALKSAYDLQRALGWRHITMTAHQVQGDPFWRRFVPKVFQRTRD